MIYLEDSEINIFAENKEYIYVPGLQRAPDV